MDNQNKQKKIVEMFNDIAPTYDKANRVLSMGVDTQWRKKACRETFKRYNNEINLIVDVACGTGDMMGYWQKEADKQNRKIGKLLGVDPSFGMIEVGKQKFPNFEFVISEATRLPIDTNSVDILSISYGIRNVVERVKAFDEFGRVVKKGGYVVILEFTKDTKKSGLLYSIKDFYMNKILPRLGGIISKNKEAYEYLPNSIENFYTPRELIYLFEEAGFKTLKNDSFNFGQVGVFIFKKF